MSEDSAAVERIYRRVLLTVGRGRITTSNDGGNVQLLQVQLGANELRDNTPRLGEYGFNSNPPEGSDAVLVFVGGDRSNGVVVGTGNQTLRFKNLAIGESVLYDSRGQSVYLSASGIQVNGGGLPVTVSNASSVTLDTPTVHITGNVQIDGNVNVNGTIAAVGNISSAASIIATEDIGDQGGSKTMADMRATYDEHSHVLTGVAGGSGTLTTQTPTPTA